MSSSEMAYYLGENVIQTMTDIAEFPAHEFLSASEGAFDFSFARGGLAGEWKITVQKIGDPA